ncbi:hypothetical protein KIN20_031337 [Parelaphostrongylus tenuis]|uniref:Uncharacterized protein n=1 Tax=Parelaphostrongylus tenuis TaxID=148309 RepID=A0AAD5R4Z1_PARTN|nr:hypothetical protein KIN20_031337 [Parelaphostrongylus tenuis]
MNDSYYERITMTRYVVIADAVTSDGDLMKLSTTPSVQLQGSMYSKRVDGCPTK